MSLLFPLGMAALGALVPLVALYLLKQRRVETRVPAAFLWRQALEDLRASSLFQRLRTPLLFFLQAAAVVLFALAAAGASLDLDVGDEPRRRILVVDRSRSMGADDEDDGATRMAVARELCQDVVDGLRGADEAMLVAFDGRAEVLVAFTTDRDRLRAAVETLAPRDRPSLPAEALRLAGSFARASPGFRSEVLVVSDGAVSGDLPLLSCAVTFVRVGRSGANQGLAEARLDRRPGEPPQLFARVENGDESPATRTLVLRRGGEVVDARQLTLPGGGEAAAFFELDDPRGADVEVVELALQGADVLAADDRVQLLLRPRVPRTGLLVRAEPSLHLDPRKLEALHPGLAVTEVEPAEAEVLLAGGTAVDLLVYDGVSPAAPSEVPAQIYVHALPPGSGLESAGSAEFPIVIDWDRTHPVTLRCRFDDVLVEEAWRLRGAERSLALVESTAGPLLLLAPVPGREVLVVPFDPARSNLPLRLAWPLLLANSLDYLLAGVARDEEASLASTGSPLRSADGGPFRVRPPGGDYAAAEPGPDGVPVFAATHGAGVYEIDGPGGPDLRALALLDAEEIRVAPRGELVLGGDAVQAAQGGVRRNLLLRDPLLLLALGLLVLEWAVWCGRR